MKLGEPSRVQAEAFPDWPKGESLNILLKAINSQNEQTTQALQQNLTFGDNLNAAIVKLDLTHATERSIPNPLKSRPVGVWAVRSQAINGGVRYSVASLDWRFIDSGDPKQPQQIGVTAHYASPYGIVSAYRNASLSVATSASIAPDTTEYSAGILSHNTSNGLITCRDAGVVFVVYTIGYSASAGGNYRGARIWSSIISGNPGRTRIPSAGATDVYIGGSELIQVSAGTTIQILCEHDTGGSVPLAVGAGRATRVSAQYVAPPSTAKNTVWLVVSGG